MTEEKFTRCPGCRTVFRVTPAQLALREGQVRCGHCRTVFDGTANLIRLTPGAAMPSPDEDTGPLTVTLRSPQALQPVAAASAAPAASPAQAQPTPSDDHIDYDERFAWNRRARLSRRRTLAYAVGIVVLVLLFAGQLAWHYRDLVAAHFPSSRPMLARMCEIGGCTIRPLRDIAGLSIDASDLQADPAHKGLLILTATIRNRAPYAVAFPHLELTLTDAKDSVVVRRALAAREYLPATAEQGEGIPRNGEVAVRLYIDASATVQSGYRVYLFYP
jgi:predicted Zn finger-like uncharacterized protein